MPNVTIYVVTNWRDLPTQTSPIHATNLNHIETGIKNLTDFINTLNTNNGSYLVLSQTPFLNGDRTKLDGIEAQANKYVLPTASPSTLGGVKIDNETIKIENGVIRSLGGKVSTLIDVQLVDLADGQILKYDATEEKWVNAEVSTKISELEDVDLTGLDDGDILKWDETEEKWVPAENGEVLDYQSTLNVLGEPGEPLGLPILFNFTGAEQAIGKIIDENNNERILYQKTCVFSYSDFENGSRDQYSISGNLLLGLNKSDVDLIYLDLAHSFFYDTVNTSYDVVCFTPEYFSEPESGQQKYTRMNIQMHTQTGELFVYFAHKNYGITQINNDISSIKWYITVQYIKPIQGNNP